MNSFGVQAQLYDNSPGVDWVNLWWIHRDLNNNPQTQEESGEDWWYSHLNVTDPVTGDPIGYLGVGYSSWLNDNLPSEGPDNGCYNPEAQNPDCESLEITGNLYAESKGALGLFDINGKMLWCRAYNNFDLQRAVQTSDGGFLAVGTTKSTRESDGSPIIYNPTSTTQDYFSDPTDCNLGDNKKHLNLVKVDANGNMEWTYIYGLKPYSSGISYACESEGYGISASSWGYRVVGNAENSIGGERDIFVLDINVNGEVLSLQGFDKTTGTSNQIAYNVVSAPNGSGFLISGRMDDGASIAPSEKAIGLFISNSYPATEIWSQYSFPDNPGNTEVNQTCWDAAFISTGEIVMPVIQDCNNCKFYDNNKGILKAYRLNPLTGSINNVTDLGMVTAADLRAGITSVSDGGFAIISSTRTYTTDPVLSNFATPPCDVGSSYNKWDTDAYVIKLSATGVVEWKSVFDSDFGRPSEPYPGDLKNEECLYAITEGFDGGLVISGNTSHNFDDGYLVKLNSDCAVKVNYTVKGDAGSEWNPAPIVGSTTWNTPKTVLGVLRIKSGGHLTIDNTTVEFADSKHFHDLLTRIVVEPGGKLSIINGAVLTTINSCPGTMWDGIFVEGSISSLPSLINQGFLEITGSTIEHARIGITAGGYFPPLYADESETTDWNKGGGIVKSSNSTFRNCRKSISFLPYDFNNASTIYDSHFICDAPMRDPYFVDSFGRKTGNNTFITLLDVNGVRIEGNNFENDLVAHNFDQDIRGFGIVSFNSRYNLTRRCDVMSTNGECVGVRNVFKDLTYGVYALATSTDKVNIRGNDFINNRHNILLDNTYYTEVSRNRFYFTGLEQHIGVFTTAAKGFNIEDNYFSDSGHSSENQFGPASWGVLNNNSGEIGGEVYLNNFDDGGFYIRNQMEQDNQRLFIDCNSYSQMSYGFQYDWTITSGNLVNQGECNSGNNIDAQTNLFYEDDGGSRRNLVLNSGSPSFEYNHHPDPLTTPVDYTTNIIVNACPLAGSFDLNEYCQTTLYSENPNGISAYNKSKSFRKSHDSLVGILLHMDSGDPGYSSIQKEKEFSWHQRQLSLNSALRWYLDSNMIDSAITILSMGDTVSDYYALIPLVTYEKDAITAKNFIDDFKGLANNLESLDPLDEVPNEIRAFCDFYEFLIDTDTLYGGIYNLDSVQENKLNIWASNGSMNSVPSQGLLNLLKSVPLIREPELMPQLRNRKEESILNPRNSTQITFNLFPNPTLNHVTITGDSLSGKIIQVIELSSGKEIFKNTATENTLTFHHIPQGVYVVRVSGLKESSYKKLVVIK